MRRRSPTQPHLTDEDRLTLRHAVWAIREECDEDDPRFVAALNIVDLLPITEEKRTALHAYRRAGGTWLVDDARAVRSRLVELLKDPAL